jgi:hypothetical protein
MPTAFTCVNFADCYAVCSAHDLLVIVGQNMVSKPSLQNKESAERSRKDRSETDWSPAASSSSRPAAATDIIGSVSETSGCSRSRQRRQAVWQRRRQCTVIDFRFGIRRQRHRRRLAGARQSRHLSALIANLLGVEQRWRLLRLSAVTFSFSYGSSAPRFRLRVRRLGSECRPQEHCKRWRRTASRTTAEGQLRSWTSVFWHCFNAVVGLSKKQRQLVISGSPIAPGVAATVRRVYFRSLAASAAAAAPRWPTDGNRRCYGKRKWSHVVLVWTAADVDNDDDVIETRTTRFAVTTRHGELQRFYVTQKLLFQRSHMVTPDDTVGGDPSINLCELPTKIITVLIFIR